MGWDLNYLRRWVEQGITVKKVIESEESNEGLYIDTSLIISYIIKCTVNKLLRQWTRKIDEIIDADDEEAKRIRDV